MEVLREVEIEDNTQGRCPAWVVKIMSENEGAKGLTVTLAFGPQHPTLNKDMLFQLITVLLAEAISLDEKDEVNFSDGKEHLVHSHIATHFLVKRVNDAEYTMCTKNSWFFRKETFLEWAKEMLKVYASIQKFTNKDEPK
jgi:hypothetical protein